MHGELQQRVETTINEETERLLQRYCTIHGIKRRDAIRKAIAMLLSRRTDPPRIDPDRPI